MVSNNILVFFSRLISFNFTTVYTEVCVSNLWSNWLFRYVMMVANSLTTIIARVNNSRVQVLLTLDNSITSFEHYDIILFT